MLDANFNTKISHFLLEIFKDLVPVDNLGIRVLLLISLSIFMSSILSHLRQSNILFCNSCPFSDFAKRLTEASAGMSLELLVLVQNFRPLNPLVAVVFLCYKVGKHPFDSQSSCSCTILEEPGLQNFFPVSFHRGRFSSHSLSHC